MTLRRYAFPLTLAAIVVAVGIVVAIVLATREEAAPDKREGTTGIEIRAKPPALIKVDGHSVGKSPVTVHVPASTTPLRIEAVRKGGAQSRSVVPDHDQLVDFIE